MSPVAYDVNEPPQWAEGVAAFEQKLLDDGAVVILLGKCPRCNDLMDVELPIALQTGGLTVSSEKDEQTLQPSRAKESAAAFRKTARCNCQMNHDGRPKDVSDGCGAFGSLVIG